MRSNDIKALKEQINSLTQKINNRINEDLSFKSIKKGEIDLNDPKNDEVEVLKKASSNKKNKILNKVEKDIKESNQLSEKKGYSAKSARKGKDLGKPGKNFKKIEDKAAKEYGSKKAGERVAGAVLAKLRKEGIETNQVSLDQLKPSNVSELQKEGIQLQLSGQLNEDLNPSMGVGAYIDDFVHSKNKKFDGKSKEQRIQMAKGAYFAATKESN